MIQEVMHVQINVLAYLTHVVHRINYHSRYDDSVNILRNVYLVNININMGLINVSIFHIAIYKGYFATSTVAYYTSFCGWKGWMIDSFIIFE